MIGAISAIGLALAGAPCDPRGVPARLVATLADDGRTITGTIELAPGIPVVDPLVLPDAPDDLTRLRTFPGAPDPGAMQMIQGEPGVWSFTTRLPRRFGGVGATAHGTFALGAFYPQPLVDGRLPELDWTAEITLPAGRIGAVGDVVGQGTVGWSGCADRLTLSVPRAARVERVELPGRTVTVLGEGRARRALMRATERLLPAIPLREPWEVLLVEAPLRRRLIRPGPGVALVSDRSFRLFPLFQSYHHHAFVAGVAAAASGRSMPLERELIGVAAADQWRDVREGMGAAGFTRALAWIPSVDFLLSSRRMAFYGETLEEVLPSDPVRDDLFEVLDPYRPAAMVAAQLDDRYGPLTARRVAAGLRADLTLPQALLLAGADPGLAEDWRGPPLVQDYTLDVGDRAVVTRQATSGPAETVVVRLDGVDHAVQLAPGQSVDFPRPQRVIVDPGRHVTQTSRMRDHWPQQRFRLVAAAGIESVNLTRFRVSGVAAAWLRGRFDTHNVLSGQVFSTRSTLLGARLGWTHKFGPLIDGISRRQRISLTAGPSVVDPTFYALDDGPVAVSGALSWAWDTRVSAEFPVDGHRLSASVDGGFFPGSRSRWVEVSGAATGLWSPHPRHVFAGRLALAAARSSREDQLIGLAGLDGMRSLPVLPPCGADAVSDCAPVATERALGFAEYRVAPLRGMSVPLGLAWWTELQLTAGVEALGAQLVDGPAAAFGGTLGIAGVGDVFGAEPSMVGFTGGWLFAEVGLDHVRALEPVPEVYLRWSQAF